MLMNAVGIDIAKWKSVMMALRPINEAVLKARQYPHTEAGLGQMTLASLGSGEDTRVIRPQAGIMS